jgi:hypothetical protein
MRLLIAGGLIGCLTLQGSVLPVVVLDSATLKVFDDYVAVYEAKDQNRFQSAGGLWIDDDASKKSAFQDGKAVVAPRENRVFATGSIHHFSGAIHVPGATIEMMRRVMEDYPNYPNYYKPDISKASFQLVPDSKPEDEHYKTMLQLTQSTLWMNVVFDSEYDSHYLRLDDHRWLSRSTTIAIKERVDAKDPSKGYYPLGQDHGLLWRTNTYWYARERNGGLDLVVDSVNLSRPIPGAVAWWGTKRTKDAVEKMLTDTRAALKLTQVAGR